MSTDNDLWLALSEVQNALNKLGSMIMKRQSLKPKPLACKVWSKHKFFDYCVNCGFEHK